MFKPRCRGCDSALLAPSDAMLCQTCREYAAGRMPVMKPGVWKIQRGLRFGRITGFAELLDEARNRSLVVGLAVLALAYAMSLTSSSILVNVPLAMLLLVVLRRISFEFDVRWKGRPGIHLHNLYTSLRQLSPRDPLLTPAKDRPASDSQWRQAMDSPALEATLEELVELIVRDFLSDLFYSYLTPDTEGPEELRLLILTAIGEIVSRAKRVNLVNFLTRDMVELVGSHLELYRRTRDRIGEKVLDSLSSADGEERLKQAMQASGELHVACLSPAHEYKALKKLVGGVLAKVLRPQDSRSRLVRTFAREIVTCCVLRPVMLLASPSFINQMIVAAMAQHAEDLERAARGKGAATGGADSPGPSRPGAGTPGPARAGTSSLSSQARGSSSGDERKGPPPRGDKSGHGAGSNVPPASTEAGLRGRAGEGTTRQGSQLADLSQLREGSSPGRYDWGKQLQQQSERKLVALTPEHLDNLWAKGRRYREKEEKLEKRPERGSRLWRLGGKIQEAGMGKEQKASTGGEIKWVRDLKTEGLRGKTQVGHNSRDKGSGDQEGLGSLDGALLRTVRLEVGGAQEGLEPGDPEPSSARSEDGAVGGTRAHRRLGSFDLDGDEAESSYPVPGIGFLSAGSDLLTEVRVPGSQSWHGTPSTASSAPTTPSTSTRRGDRWGSVEARGAGREGDEAQGGQQAAMSASESAEFRGRKWSSSLGEDEWEALKAANGKDGRGEHRPIREGQEGGQEPGSGIPDAPSFGDLSSVTSRGTEAAALEVGTEGLMKTMTNPPRAAEALISPAAGHTSTKNPKRLSTSQHGSSLGLGINVVPGPTPGNGRLQARVVGAYLAEGRGGEAFVTYAIAVVDSDGTSWTTRRRYRSFEVLHRRLRERPLYRQRLPPKRYLARSLDRHFVLQRRAQLDKYLQDVLSVPSVAEHHDVVDFLSPLSERYGSADADAASGSLGAEGPFDATWRPLRRLAGGDRKEPTSPFPSPSTPTPIPILDPSSASTSSPTPSSSLRFPSSSSSLRHRHPSRDGDAASSTMAGAALQPGEYSQQTAAPNTGQPAGRVPAVPSSSLWQGGGGGGGGGGGVGAGIAEEESEDKGSGKGSGRGLTGGLGPLEGVFDMPEEEEVAESSRGGERGSQLAAGAEVDGTTWRAGAEPPGRGQVDSGEAHVEGEGPAGPLSDGESPASSLAGSEYMEDDDVAIPPEWNVSNLSAPLLSLVDLVFQLHRNGWIRRQVVWIARQVLELVMGDAIDDFMLTQLQALRRDDTVAAGVRYLIQMLWPDGVFFSRHLDCAQASAMAGPPDPLGLRQPPLSFEERVGNARRASLVKEIFLDAAPSALVRLMGSRAYKRGAKDVYCFLQSPVCVKQLAHGALEGLLVAVFPDLHALVRDVRLGRV